MPYWEIVTWSFTISWRHRYLWLLALFSGEAGGGFSFSFNFGTPPRGGKNAPVPSAVAEQAAGWLGSHIWLVITLAVLWLLLVIAFFVLAAICEGALVRGSAEHDASRPFGLVTAWLSGVATMGTIIRFRLLLILLFLPVAIVLLALGAGVVLAIVKGNAAAAIALGVIVIVLLLVSIPYAIYLAFLDRLGTRAAVLEELAARPALVRGHRLLVKRIGRVLLVWLLAIAVGIGLGIGVGVAMLILAVPAIIAGIAAYSAASAGLWIFFAIYLLVWVLLAIVVESFVAAQGSTYWTLAFRRLDIEYPAQYAYPYPVAAPPQGSAT